MVKVSKTSPEVPVWKRVVGDFFVTWIWIATSSFFSEIAAHFANKLQISELSLNVILLVIGLACLSPVSKFLWGGNINPVNHIGSLVRGTMTLTDCIFRMLGQLAGAVLGTLTAMAVVPLQHQGRFHLLSGGLREGLAVEVGYACESALVFFMVLLSFYSSDHPEGEGYFLTLAPHLTTVAVVVIGSEVTGPSLNPYQSFVWNYVYTDNQHSLKEHVSVFWMGPLTGAVSAALFWRYISPIKEVRKRDDASSSSSSERSSRDKARGRAAAKAITTERNRAS
ncbi:hypothetical protein CEUSTIGMA_g11862.t1 [Chlamydomonas eustigma]|uniref:Aquaporin n=1 Tax=Chlamydomonas eustigma TaxID=1157962 RepID=A0A250XNF1_9CHLO|nr:hypothetical protein CEUSTIGMA_g11862.t1 [Chlamydomonas eustigma]|eukprot:GAX84442.1 hypothetical protein CEUSTIGMA_g11862.t1 [Chlamydomonas eustigma]